MRKYMYVFAVTLLLGSAMMFGQEKIVVEGDKEVLYLDLSDPSGWNQRDGMEISASELKCPPCSGDKKTVPAVMMHLDYAKIQGTFPRMHTEPAVVDFSEWEQVEFMAYVKSTRPNMPTRPVEVGFGKSGELAESKIVFPKKEVWQKVVVTVESMGEKAKNVERIMFGCEKGKYKKGDVTDFHFGDFRLVRAKK